MTDTVPSLTTAQRVAIVDEVIRSRRTVKVFADPHHPAPATDALLAPVEAAIEIAGWAPFHYAVHASHRHGEQNAIVPWRFHLVDASSCRTLLAEILARADTAPWTMALGGKVPRMLAAAGALVLSTWLPDPMPDAPDEARLAEHTKRNEEHLAATAAATENLLLAATARGLASYWSSGGILREPEALLLCGVPADQRLLGAVFFFEEPTDADDYVTGKLRDQRGPVTGWSRRVELML